MIPLKKNILIFLIISFNIGTMKLRAWVDKEKDGGKAQAIYEKLAQETGVKWRYVYFIALGAERPGQDLAVKLVKATNGEVGLFDLLPHLKEAL